MDEDREDAFQRREEAQKEAAAATEWPAATANAHQVAILHAPDDWGEDGCPILDGYWVYVDDARDEDAIGPFPTRQDAEAVAADRSQA
jgi:hypothetical protein